MSQVQTLSSSRIRTEGLQVRAATDRGHVDDLAELFGEDNPSWPESLPAIVVFHDGQDYWCADGHHRLAAAVEAGCTEVLADVRRGSKVDALYYALSANTEHGLKRTPADRKNAILIAYGLDPEVSNSEIARLCRVDEKLVRYYLAEHKRRPSATSEISEVSLSDCSGSTSDISEVPQTQAPAPVIKRDKNGRRMDVSRIGKGKPALEGGPAFPVVGEMDAIVRLLREAQTRLNAIAKSPGAELLRSDYLRCERHGDEEKYRSIDIGNAIASLSHYRPHSACPSCRQHVRNGCDVCKGLGWITASTWDRLPERLKTA